MKNIKNILLIVTICICSQTTGAERPTPLPQQNLASLQGLPKDLKGYLVPFIASGDIERGIVTAASINKSYHSAINDPSIMLTILNWALTNARYTAPVIDLVEKLQKRNFLLPVMKNARIVAWIAKTKAQLQYGKELFNAIKLKDELEGPGIEEASMETIIDLLKNKNIDLNWTEKGEETPLIFSVRYGYEEIVKMLLQAGANPNATASGTRFTPLWGATYTNRPAITELLLAFKADPNFQDKSGQTALMKAAAKGFEDVVAKLLAYKADPNIQDHQGFTALHHNVLNNENKEITKMLLDAGANPTVKNSAGLTAENIAEERYGLYSEQLHMLERASQARKAQQEKK